MYSIINSQLRDSDLIDDSILELSKLVGAIVVTPDVHISSLISFNFSQSFWCQSWRLRSTPEEHRLSHQKH